MGRWGKKFVDNRNWVGYNEELVLRGTFFLDCEWVDSWHDELLKMNEGKVGKPFEFPDSLIRLQAVWHQMIDFRGIEGVTRKLFEAGLIVGFNDYTSAFRRVSKMKVGIKLPSAGSVEVACDGSGFKPNSRGEYRAYKYKDRKRKKFIKVTISADPRRSKLLDVDVCLEGAGDSEAEVAVKHLKKLHCNGRRISKFYGDGAFDVKRLFNTLEKLGVESAIKIRCNASTIAGGSMRRAREVRDYQKKGYKKWAEEREYGKRWVGTEGIFSAVKRKFGEKTRSKKLKSMCVELKQRFWAYDVLQQYARTKLQKN